jgi:hypothetical protein
MSLKLVFLMPLYRWTGAGWHCDFTTQGRPFIEYRCPLCKKEDAWVSGIRGFLGVAPTPHCCANHVPYPETIAEFAEHLHALPKFHDGVEQKQIFLDTDDEGFDGVFTYEKSRL